MFVKREVKVTLVENYEESNKVEDDMDNIAQHTLELEVKPTASKKPLLLLGPKKNTQMN